MSFSKKQIIVIVIASLVTVALAIGLPFLSKPSDDLIPKFALSQLAFSVVAFFIIFTGLILNLIQLRKSMAKPKLEVIFTKTNNSEITMDILPKTEDRQHLKLFVINKGNAITDLFQIDFDIPMIFNPTINSNTVNSVHHHANGSNRIVSFINKHEYVCFVNITTSIPSLVLDTHEEEYEKYSSHLVIPYKIFGDWAKPHEGKLIITYNKKYKGAS